MKIQSFIFFFLLSATHVKGDCSTSYCATNSSVAIQYPFWLEDQPPQNCRLPGFNLHCNSQQRTILNIPNSGGDFYVNSIYYYIKRITLYDPNNCLPMQLLNLNLSSSPFTAASYQDYTFLNCSKALINSTYAIACLGNSSTVVLALKDQFHSVQMPMCKKMVTLPIPVSSYDSGLSSTLPEYLELTWNAPTCTYCSSPTGPLNTKPVLRIIALSFAIPAAVIPVLIVCISCCICMLRKDNNQTNGSGRTSSGLALSSFATVSLDEATIETYEKITTGESTRTAGPIDSTCAICLAEYAPKDTLKFMPKCEHCFHVECIDKWFSMHSTCPICRTSQTPTNLC